MDKAVSELRQAWNGYVFARIGAPRGAGMKVETEAEAFDRLSSALAAFTAQWDDR